MSARHWILGLLAIAGLAGCNGKRDKATPAAPAILATVAGSGTSTYGGDGGPATSAGISPLRHVALDAQGNLYFADGLDRVRRVDAATGTITTIAGTGVAGFNGEGLPATSAQVNIPMDVAVAADGTVYICEHSNHRVRAIDPLTGILSTVAGTGTSGYSGDNGPATAALLNAPQGIFLTPAGVLYIADTDNHAIRRVQNGIIATVAGGMRGSTGDGGPATAAGLRNPNGVEVDAQGNIWIADTLNHRIRRVDGTTGVIETVVGTGTKGSGGDNALATLAELDQPHGLALDRAGRLWIADVGNQVVRVVELSGVIRRVMGTGVVGFNGEDRLALDTQLNYPMSVEVGPTGAVYVNDSGNFRVRRLQP